MKNRIEISTDGVNAYANIEVNASKIGIRILSAFLVLEILGIIGLFSQEKSGEIASMIIPILIILVLFVGLPVIYLLWNLYGKETLIVNTKSISWAYDFGFFKTNLKTVKYNRLGSGYENVRGEGDNEIGRLIFLNFREEDNLPEVIHHTTVLLSRKEIQEFDNEISNIFEKEFFNKNGFIPCSQN